MYTYKNKTDYAFSVIGVGIVEAGQEFQSETLIENPNIEITGGLEETAAPAPEQAVAEAPQIAPQPVQINVATEGQQ